ncbi:MAG: SDR family NAD(P)-dependent oxidoreductase [Spirochaetales bacterium]|nr:SDR family NAD(P)-dependent oxidoreductase [Spirochaetales bacterium]
MPYALITGATSGIGKAFAELLGSQGYNLILCGRRQEVLQRVASDIARKFSVSTEIFVGDLGDAKAVDSLLSIAVDFEIEWLVNNAGFGSDSPFSEEDPKVLRSMIRLHTETPVILCRYILPKMVLRNKGFIVNVSSLASQFPLPTSPLYTSTKAMVHAFTQALALDVMDLGIRVQSLLPGFTHTDFHGRLSQFDHPQKSRGLIRWADAYWVAQKSYDAMVGRSWKRVTLIPGFSNRALRFIVHLLPWRLFRLVAKRV